MFITYMIQTTIILLVLKLLKFMKIDRSTFILNMCKKFKIKV